LDLRDRLAVAQHTNRLAGLDQIEKVLCLIAEFGEGGFTHAQSPVHICTPNCTL